MILLTGSAGYIGSHLSYMFEKNKIKYLGIDNFSKSSSSNIINSSKFSKIDYGSDKKINLLLSNNSFSTVIHSAAYAYVLEGERKKKIYFNNNVKKTKSLINLCIKKKIKNFIFLSSSNVYEDSNKKKTENIKIKKNNIKNNYGKTKFLIENYLKSKKKNFQNLIILRLFNIAGYDKYFKYNEKNNELNLRIFPLLINKIKNKKIIKIFVKKRNSKNIYPKRDYLHINDLTDLFIKIIKNLNNYQRKEIYNVGLGTNYSLNEIQSLIKKKLSLKMKKNMNINYTLINSKELISTLSDIKKTKKTFNWKPKNTINDIVDSCLKNLIRS